LGRVGRGPNSFRFRQALSSKEAFWLIRKSFTMYRKEKPLLLKGSTSALANNLSIEVNLEKGIISYATVHKSLVNLVSASLDGTSVNPRQIPCKEPSASQGFTMILQVNSCKDNSRWCRVLHVNADNNVVVLLPFNFRAARLEKKT